MRGTFSKGGKGKPSFSALAGNKQKGIGDKSRKAFQDSGLGKEGRHRVMLTAGAEPRQGLSECNLRGMSSKREYGGQKMVEDNSHPCGLAKEQVGW